MSALDRTYLRSIVPVERPEHYFDTADPVDSSASRPAISGQSVRTGQGIGLCWTCADAGQLTQAADTTTGSACVTHLRDPNATVKATRRRPDDDLGLALSLPLGSAGYAPGTARKTTGPSRTRPRRYRNRKRRPWAKIPEHIRARLAKKVRRPTGRFVPRVIGPDEIPPGLRVVLNQPAARAVFDEHPDTSGWQANRWRNWRAVWQALTNRANWLTGGITTTHAQLAQAATEALGRSVSVGTVRRVIKWAIGAKLLLLVEPGASAAAIGADVNRAPTYAVLAPVVEVEPVDNPEDKNAHPPDPRSGSGSVAVGTYRLNGHDQTRPWPNRAVPEKTPDQLRAARTLRSIAGWTDITDKELRKILERWFKAGWCLTAIIHGVDQGPAGQRWPAPPPTAERLDRWRADAAKAHRPRPRHELQPARRRAAWLCWRLRHWIDDAGMPLPPPVRAAVPGERIVRAVREPQPAPPPPAPIGPVSAGQAAARAIAARYAKPSARASALAQKQRIADNP